MNTELKERLDGMVKNHEVLLFMKGNRSMPQCGFSATVIQILDEYLPTYETVNVLADPDVRTGIKEFSDWPTIPQLYVKGEFIGGCDIVREMHANGELSDALGKEPIPVEVPNIKLSSTAVAAFKEAAKDQDYEFLRLEVSAGFQHGLSFGPALKNDIVADCDGFPVRMDRGSAQRAEGLSIDFVSDAAGQGFKIDNPNAPPKVKEISAAELKAKLDNKEEIHLFDVRPESEREKAKIEESVALDEAGQEKFLALGKDAPIVFVCHHGGRSARAAQEAIGRGYTNVFNLTGGVNLYSDVEPSIGKY